MKVWGRLDVYHHDHAMCGVTGKDYGVGDYLHLSMANTGVHAIGLRVVIGGSTGGSEQKLVHGVSLG